MITFYTDNMSWGFVNENGYLVRGQSIQYYGGKTNYREGVFGDGGKLESGFSIKEGDGTDESGFFLQNFGGKKGQR